MTTISAITANDLKNHGISPIEERLTNAPEAIISVHGQERYVVMSLEHYRKLQELEVELAWMQTQADLAAGRYRKDSVDEHMARVSTQ
ncbi:prevent-host-death protein [Achromatium sp. WMS3]|nr:prevent-host-death protein [Achromatium sp. WMS3]